MQRIIVITGTDTDVGKTALTELLIGHLRAAKASVAAVKPICSGGREDGQALRRAMGGTLKLNEINPWHFRSPLAPLLAARKERKRVELREVVAHIHTIGQQFQFVLVEGAGGLLSPLGEHFSARELIGALNAEVIVVARNQLGVINQVRVTLEALPPIIAARAHVALMSPKRPDLAARSNPGLLAEFVGEAHVALVPWIRGGITPTAAAKPRLREVLDTLLR